MARILITSGPTRQYLDPVRYLTNASSGKMGRALYVAKHRGSACDETIFPYQITDRGIQFESSAT